MLHEKYNKFFNLNNLGDIKTELYLYAHDLNLVVEAKTKIELNIIAYLKIYYLKCFFDKNKLTIHSEKTNFVSFYTKHKMNHLNLIILFMMMMIVTIRFIKQNPWIDYKQQLKSG